MKILLVNPANTQGTKHSRKGMYVPLGILTIATVLLSRLKDRVDVHVVDEDVDSLDTRGMKDYDLVGFYTTTFNYGQAVRYARTAKEFGCRTVVGGPHATVLAQNILNNQTCFDYVLRYEAEEAFVQLVSLLLSGEPGDRDLEALPNMAFRRKNGEVSVSGQVHFTDLSTLPNPSREFVPFEKYVENYHKIYPEMPEVLPGSIYSSKGCSWRDKTGGCIFCARLEEGVRFRPIARIWEEIAMLKERYGVNSIWDIADDNLNNRDWFIRFVDARPGHLEDVEFFIYSRVNPIRPWVFPYFERLNVREVFLGVESGDNRLLRGSFKGQTRERSFQAIRDLNAHGVKFYPSFVLGLPGEDVESLEMTYSMCREIAEMGGLDRMSATILKPIPGSSAYNRVLEKTRLGRDLAAADDVDLGFLERYWVESFTEVDYDTIAEYRLKIEELMKGLHVFGSAVQREEQ